MKHISESSQTQTIAGRVAYIVNHSFPHSSNGYAVRTHGISSALVALGHSIIVINRPGRPWDIDGTKVARSQLYHLQHGVKYLSLPEPSMRACRDYKQWCDAATDVLTEAFRVFKPAVVMAASNWENATPALRAAQRLHLPFFYEVRGFWELSRASSDPSWQLSDEFKLAVANETSIANAATRVITLNPLMQSELVKRGVAVSKIMLVPNGVSHLPSPLARTKIAKNHCVHIGYVGSFAEYEGLEDLLQACALLCQGGMKLQLSLVGSGSQSGIINSVDNRASKKLQAKAESLNIAHLVRINARVANEQIADFYKAIDIIVNPRLSCTVTELVSSLKPIEAASYGKPVLLSDVAPNRFLAEESSAISLFNKGDVTDLAYKIRMLSVKISSDGFDPGVAYTWVAALRQFKHLSQPLSESILNIK